MKKKLIEENIINKTSKVPFTYGDIKKLNLLDDDKVFTEFVDESPCCDEYVEKGFYLHVVRPRIETDDEFNKRIDLLNRRKENYRKLSIEELIKLTNEFKDVNKTNINIELDKEDKIISVWCSNCGHKTKRGEIICGQCGSIFMEEKKYH